MASEYARRGLELLKGELGGLYDSLSDADKQLIFRCLRRAGTVQAGAVISGGMDDSERAHVKAQLSSLASGSAAAVESGFWNVVKKLGEMAIAALKKFAGVL